MHNDFLTTLEAASVLNLHPGTIKRFCRLGKLKGEKVNHGWLIHKEAIAEFARTYSEPRGRPIKKKPVKRIPFSSGTDAPWYKAWDITEEQREIYRGRSKGSHMAKVLAASGKGPKPVHQINEEFLKPESLMPKCNPNGLRSLSLFSGGGGLDLGFERAGFSHVASYEILDFAGLTLERNRPDWQVFGGNEGDVTTIDWRQYRHQVDVIHGGPPCQPFSTSGRQKGINDIRDMVPEFVRAVIEVQPPVFVLENVPGLAARKFQDYLNEVMFQPLATRYKINAFFLHAASFGVPQTRRRLFFVGFQDTRIGEGFMRPSATHSWSHLKHARNRRNQNSQMYLPEIGDASQLLRCMGAREALGLPDLGHDALAPTLRSSLTGPRHTTSILSSTSAARLWAELEIWPNGVALTRKAASEFVAKNKHFRLSVPDCAVLQGFPDSWRFDGPVYKALGQIGNSVAPPVAYWLAKSISQSMSSRA